MILKEDEINERIVVVLTQGHFVDDSKLKVPVFNRSLNVKVRIGVGHAREY